MPDFLFATLDAGGNLPPALGIARELVRDGHRVRFLGEPQQAGPIEAAGAEFRAYEQFGPDGCGRPHVRAAADLHDGVCVHRRRNRAGRG